MLLEIIIVAALTVAFLVEVVLTETERFGWATILLAWVGFASYWFNLGGMGLWVKAHVLQTLLFIGVYLIAGVVWSFIKWFSYLISYRNKWREAKVIDATNKVKWIAEWKSALTKEWENYTKALEEFNTQSAPGNTDAYRDRFYIQKPKAPDVLPGTDEQWDAYYEKNYQKHYLQARNFSKPLASDNKAKIIAWMCFWVFSLLGTFINDPVRRFFNFLFSQFKALYQRLSDHIFKDEVKK